MRNLLIASLAILTLSQFETAMAEKVYTKADLKKIQVNVGGRMVERYQISSSELIKFLPPQPSAPWIVKKTAWSSQDEANWQSFVKGIGRAIQNGECNTVDKCLLSSANPYRSDIDMRGWHYSDCADFPMYLRAYFAYKNNLPFAFGTGITPNAPTAKQIAESQARVDKAYADGNQKTIEGALKAHNDLISLNEDRRYTRNGNYFSNRYTIPAKPSDTVTSRDFFRVGKQLNDGYSSGSFRMLFTPPNKFLPDFYSPVINLSGIQVGTVTYKVSGHVAMVYDINQVTGEIRLMDAHPDNSVSTLAYSSEFMKSNPTQGDGFKNWRPLRVEPTLVDSNGVILEGKTSLASDEEIPTYSLEQYFGNRDMRNADASLKDQYVVGRRILDWYDYVKVRMTNGRYRLDPLAQMRADVNGLCTAMKDRVEAVNKALDNNVDRQKHPNQLPNNIFGASGDWESYSTPSRDLRLRLISLDIVAKAKSYMKKQAIKDPYFSYAGDNLKRDLIKAYVDTASSCFVTYKNSNDQEVKLSFPVALKRLTTISFDPYFCAERRWGASSQAELRSCGDDAEKAQWYRFQQFLRNTTEKDTTAQMGWDLDELQMKNNGAANQSSTYDILEKLNKL